MDFVKWMDKLPFVVKIIFALPVLGFMWGLYRLVKGIAKKNLVLTIVGVVWLFGGIVFLWLVDLITIIMDEKPTILVD